MTEKIKVMIIDDSNTICRTAELFLLKEGYEVVKVMNGFDAIAIIMEEKPDVIFVDVLMPKLGGLETCQIIKGHPDFEDTPIIFLSSKDGAYDMARGQMVGADAYLTKPFTKDSIVEMVKKFTLTGEME